MRYAKVFVILRKEVLDILRDRRTLISMVVVPVLLFPALMILLPDLMVSLIKEETEKVSVVAVEGLPDSHAFVQQIEGHESLEVTSLQDPMVALAAGDIQAVVTLPGDFDETIKKHDSPEIKVSYDSTELRSKVAHKLLQVVAATYSAQLIVERLEEAKISPALLTPLTLTGQDHSSEEARSGAMVAAFLPYLLILLSMMGALYPAVDLTAGEKERGTLETLLVSPASRLELVFGKFIAVFFASLTTAALTCLSLWATFALASDRMMKVFAAGGDASFSISPLSALLILLLLAPVACFFAALLISLSTFARSYKEAMSYVSPLMILIIVPALISSLPGIGPSVGLSLVPIAGPSILMADVLKGNISGGFFALTFAASCVYAALGMWLSAWLFKREQVLLRS